MTNFVEVNKDAEILLRDVENISKALGFEISEEQTFEDVEMIRKALGEYDNPEEFKVFSAINQIMTKLEGPLDQHQLDAINPAQDWFGELDSMNSVFTDVEKIQDAINPAQDWFGELGSMNSVFTEVEKIQDAINQ